MTYLPDVNVWIALVVAEHAHHESALEWLDECLYAEGGNVIFCRVTQMGLLRLLTNSKVMGKDALSAAQAWSFLDRLLAGRPISFTHEPAELEREWRETTRRHQRHGPNSWTDSYLAAFSATAGSKLVTFDQALARRPGVEALLLT